MTPEQQSNATMGPFLQMRLWATTAPTSERIFAAVGGVLAVALVAWALVPEGGGSESVAAGDATFSDGGFLEEGAALDGVGTDVPSTDDSTPGVEPTFDENGAPIDPAVGDVPVDGAAPLPDSPTGGATPGDAGADPAGAPAPAGGAGGGGGQPAAGPLTASDRGVTPESVKVGLVTLNLGGLEAAGFAAGLRGDIRQTIKAYVDAANKAGGINGRKIAPVVKTVDLVSEDDQRRKCLEFTKTDKVFAIVDSVGFLTEPTKACVSVENKTPLYTAIPGSAREIAKAAPYQISPRKDHSRAVRDYVAAAKADGFFDPAKGFKRLGLVTDECEVDTLADLKAALAQAGVKNVSEFRVACDITAQRSVGGPAVLQHQRDGVSHVFFGIANPAVTSYTNVAENANYRPKIFVSDWWTLSTNQSAEDFNPAVFDGARGVTSTVDGDTAVGKPLPELTRKCSKIMQDAGIPPITGAPADIEVVIMCEHFELFLKMARNAGSNLTRSGMTQNIGSVGVFNGSTVFQSSFDRPGKYTGGDAIKISVWKASCKCWHAASPYRKAYA